MIAPGRLAELLSSNNEYAGPVVSQGIEAIMNVVKERKVGRFAAMRRKGRQPVNNRVKSYACERRICANP